MDQVAIFQPFVATMILTMVVWAYMYGRRLPFIFLSGLDAKKMTPLELARVSPPQVSNPSDNLKNLFELPTVFYAVVIYLYVTNQVDPAHVGAAWVFFLFRATAQRSALHVQFHSPEICPLRGLCGSAVVHGLEGRHCGGRVFSGRPLNGSLGCQAKLSPSARLSPMQFGFGSQGVSFTTSF